MHRRNICFYCVSAHLGGAERSLLDLLSGLRFQNDFILNVLLPTADGPIQSELQTMGITYEIIEIPKQILKISRSNPIQSLLSFIVGSPAFFLYLWRVRKYWKRKKIDIVHTTGIKCHLFSPMILFGTKISLVWHLRDIFNKGILLFLFHTFYRWNKNKVTVIANSKATAASFSSTIPIHIVYNGLDHNFNHVSELDENISFDNDLPIVGIIGVLAKWKGQLDFIEMAGILKSRGIKANFIIVGDQIYDTFGDSGYKENLQERINDLCLIDDVHFMGFCKNIVSIYRHLAVLVHASNRPEPFGRVIIEAQFCEVPVVASAAGGVIEIIEDGWNGLLFKPGNITEMANCVEKMINDLSLRNKIAKNGRENAEIKFDLKSHIKNITQVYNSLR